MRSIRSFDTENHRNQFDSFPNTRHKVEDGMTVMVVAVVEVEVKVVVVTRVEEGGGGGRRERGCEHCMTI